MDRNAWLVGVVQRRVSEAESAPPPASGPEFTSARARTAPSYNHFQKACNTPQLSLNCVMTNNLQSSVLC